MAWAAGPGQAEVVAVEVAPGSTVLHVLRASGMLARHPEIDLATQRVGIWGRLRSLSDPVRDRDRIEIYRALKVDPKEARRLRYRGQRKAG
ncbi:RnfH family protein [Eleftheria terrae]|uniref:RnfH family protein n=1 Tax=Eleftheria terrae TaxID=1597781 RepID=UPI00263A7DE5|nr:RnfH family protein [Eleftheria terrae]WKB53215.1 RnfH family protein [Eleftheria terrae]